MATYISNLLRIGSRRCISCSRKCFSSTANNVKNGPVMSTYGTSQQPRPPLADNAVSLTEPFPSLNPALFIHSRSPEELFKTELTTLDNGVRIATEAGCGQFCTIGVVIDSGSRYEVGYPTGVSHFLEKIAFNSTENNPSADVMYEELAEYGAIVDCQTTRDSSIYASSCHISGMDPVMRIIGDAVLRPTFTDDEIKQAEEIVLFDVGDKLKGINCEPLLTDWIHAASYRSNTLGLLKHPLNYEPGQITKDMLYNFIKTHFAPERIVVAGIGVNHEEMVQSVRKYFEQDKPIWEKNPSLVSPSAPELDQSIAQYTGGCFTDERDLGGVSFGPDPFPEVAHFVLGLESCGYLEPDFVPFCVLNALMGGGSSFSAGGPGKGMYTRLYTNVLNRQHWMTSAVAYNHSYKDSGIFCIQGSAPPEGLHYVAEVIVREFLTMSGEITVEELERAKNQLQSMLLMNLEQKPVMFEDVGRQVLGHGYRKMPMDYMEQIKNVQKSDIIRIVERLLSSKTSVVGYGNLKFMPEYEQIDQAISKRDPGLLTKKTSYSFFR